MSTSIHAVHVQSTVSLFFPQGRPGAARSCAVGAMNTATTGRKAMTMGLADAVPGPLKTVFTKKPKPASRRCD